MGGRGGSRGGGGGGALAETISLPDGVELRMPPFADKTGEFQNFRIWKDGNYAGSANFGVIGTTGVIQDVSLETSARGQGLMKSVYPAIEDRMRAQGVRQVKLQTVSDAVGEKVWRPLGFRVSSESPGVKNWVKDL